MAIIYLRAFAFDTWRYSKEFSLTHVLALENIKNWRLHNRIYFSTRDELIQTVSLIEIILAEPFSIWNKIRNESSSKDQA